MPRNTGEQHALGALDAQSAARLVQASSDVALVLDHEGTILDVMTQVDDVATQQLRAWRGKPWVQTVSPDSRQKVEAMLRDAQAAADADIGQSLALRLAGRVTVIDVWNKADATPAGVDFAAGHEHLQLSAKTGAGLDALRQRLLQLAGWQSGAEGLYIARERHVQALRRVGEHLGMAGQYLDAQAQSLDLLAEELRMAQNALNDITGAFSADDLLGVIFSSFCIGK
jgi:tRNA modification GTPase